MKVFIHIDPSFPEQTRNSIEERIHAKLDRLAEDIREVRLSLRDENGPKGGTDLRCRVHIICEKAGEVITEVTETKVSKALSGALSRSVETVRQRREKRIRSRRSESAEV